MTLPNLWNGTPFNANDTVLLEWTDPEGGGRAVWQVDAHYFPEDEDEQELAVDDGIGLLVEGEENIFPDTVTVLEPGSAPISLDGLEKVAAEDIKVGDVIVVVLWEVTLEFTATAEALLDASNESYPCVYALDFTLGQDQGKFDFQRRVPVS